MPELITDTLLVVERFKHGGDEYERGDRLPAHHRWVRRVAREDPELFAVEYAPEPVDLSWLAGLEDDSELRYRNREAEKARQERARRDELEAQDAPQPELERRDAKQEAERKKRDEQAREDVEREKLERRIELTAGYHC
jgi:hypothetical protein